MSPRITALQLQGSEKWRVVFQVMWRQTAGSTVNSARPSLKAGVGPPPSHRRLSRCTPNQGNLSFYRMYNCERKAGFTGLWFSRLLECWIQPVHWQLKNPRETTGLELISSCWSPSSANITTCLLINRHMNALQTQGPWQRAIKICLDPLK